ncbi:hypothetical protein CFC21_088468 [Triticum aestivum]|uniref:Uncharacterized protein n=2 Tax=Triticum aestivum TaxID=4565 RepID=A0A3B6PP93_WHEAT|nr:hypothetical protein CFC21_088468 [Triticum aestivum]
MTVSLLTGTGKFNISDFVPALSWLDLQGVQAKLRRVHRQFDGLNTKLLVPGGARGNGRRARLGGGPVGLRGHASVGGLEQAGARRKTRVPSRGRSKDERRGIGRTSGGRVAGGRGCGRGRPNRIGGEAAGRIRSGPATGAGRPDQTHGRGASMAPMGSSLIRGDALALASHHGRAHSRRVECIVGTTHVEEEEQHWVIVAGEEEE